MRKILVIVLTLFSFVISAQEVVLPIGSFLQAPVQRKSYKASGDTLALPLWDDFSSLMISDSLWESHGCGIDIYGSINPPSIGVVEFDAMDSVGGFYGSYEKSVVSDMLVSHPINLFFPSDQSIYLSFMYEPGGHKEMPEKQDSLVLQFYSPVDSSWTTVWYALGGDSLKPRFRQVILQINDSKYLQRGFRFRFVAYSSLGTASFPSLVSDCDFWYVDYVYLDRNRYAGDTVYRDVALQYPLQWRFGDYTAVPLDHYRDVAQNINHHVLVRFRNNDGVGRTIDSLYVVFRKKTDASLIDTLFLGSYSFPPYKDFFVKNDKVNYVFPQFTDQDVEVEAQTRLVTDNFDPVENNQVASTVYLTNFYAYDDGSAEAGYGLYGDGTFQALVAARFYTYKDDYLKGVKIFFNKTYGGRQPRYFYLMVWENDTVTGKPGKMVYEKAGMEIDFDHLGEYQTYYLDTLLRVTDTFYIGWKKTDEQLMNVGLDLNDIRPNYKFYNITGEWLSSSIEGNLMIRPIMGHVLNTAVPQQQMNVNIYPNPAHNYLMVQIQGRAMLKLYSVDGRLVMVRQIADRQRLDVSGLLPGLYILRLIDSHGRTISKKIVVR